MAALAHNRMQNDIDEGNQAVSQYYNDAAQYEEPYTQYANEDFSNGRNALYRTAGLQAKNPRYNQETYNKFLTLSPDELLGYAMQGYSMSPMAQQEMKYSMSGLENEMAASGELGSGRNAGMAAELGNTIYNQDSSRYLKSLKSTASFQGKVLGDYDQETRELAGLFQDMLGTEENASKNMADNAMRAAQMSSNLSREESRNEQEYGPLNEISSIYGAYEGFKNPRPKMRKRF